MAHNISWYVEKRVILITLYGDLADDEFTRVGESLYDFVKTGIQPIFLLVDVRKVSRMPSKLTQISSDLSRFRGNTEHAWTIVLSNNSLFNFIGIIASKVVGVPMRSFGTLEEVNAFISHNAPELASTLASLLPGAEPNQ